MPPGQIPTSDGKAQLVCDETLLVENSELKASKVISKFAPLGSEDVLIVAFNSIPLLATVLEYVELLDVVNRSELVEGELATSPAAVTTRTEITPTIIQVDFGKPVGFPFKSYHPSRQISCGN